MRRGERLLLRQQIIHRDLSDLLTVEDERDHLSVAVDVKLSVPRGFASAGWFAVHLDLAVNEVDDPVDGDAVPGVQGAFECTVKSERSVGDFDGEVNVSGLGMALQIVACLSTHRAHIWLGFAGFGGGGALNTTNPSPRQGLADCIVREPDRDLVRGLSSHFANDPTI